MFGAIWEWLSALGIHDEPVGERRRIRLTNQSAVIGAVSCGGFAVYYALGGPAFRTALVSNLVAVVVLFGALALSRRGARTLSRVAILMTVNVAVFVASMVVGGHVGFVYYFFLFAAVAFLLFEDQWVFKWAFASMSAAAFVYARLHAPRD